MSENLEKIDVESSDELKKKLMFYYEKGNGENKKLVPDENGKLNIKSEDLDIIFKGLENEKKYFSYEVSYKSDGKKLKYSFDDYLSKHKGIFSEDLKLSAEQLEKFLKYIKFDYYSVNMLDKNVKYNEACIKELFKINLRRVFGFYKKRYLGKNLDKKGVKKADKWELENLYPCFDLKRYFDFSNYVDDASFKNLTKLWSAYFKGFVYSGSNNYFNPFKSSLPIFSTNCNLIYKVFTAS